MKHRHVKEGYEDSVEAVEDILDRGSVEDWRGLAAIIREDPYGKAAKALEVVLANCHIYGTTVLWKNLLKAYRDEDSQRPLLSCKL